MLVRDNMFINFSAYIFSVDSIFLQTTNCLTIFQIVHGSSCPSSSSFRYISFFALCIIIEIVFLKMRYSFILPLMLYLSLSLIKSKISDLSHSR